MAVQLGSADSGNLGFSNLGSIYLGAARQHQAQHPGAYSQPPEQVRVDPQTVPGGQYTDAQHGQAQDAQALQQDRFGLSAWLNQQELTQKETLRLQQMKQAVSDVMSDPNLSEQEKQDAALRLKTGIDHLSMRAAAARTAALDQQTQDHMHASAQLHTIARGNSAQMAQFQNQHTSVTPQGQEVIWDLTGRPHFPPQRDHSMTQEETARHHFLEHGRHIETEVNKANPDVPIPEGGSADQAFWEARDRLNRTRRAEIDNRMRRAFNIPEGEDVNVESYLDRMFPGRGARRQAAENLARQRMGLAPAPERPQGASSSPLQPTAAAHQGLDRLREEFEQMRSPEARAPLLQAVQTLRGLAGKQYQAMTPGERQSYHEAIARLRAARPQEQTEQPQWQSVLSGRSRANP